MVETRQIQRHRTALRRLELSRPVRMALHDGLVGPGVSFFDYGCGRGGDVRRLRSLGIASDGWDPALRPSTPLREADVVNLGYVVNVIEDPSERTQALQTAWGLARQLLVVAARLTTERGSAGWTECSDGFVTGRDTFQKFYEQEDLRGWIDGTLQVSSIAAAPGIFYVFRDPSAAQAYLAQRIRRQPHLPRIHISRSERLFEEHQPLLESLMAFVAARGRLPQETELSDAPEIKETFGSLKRAFAVVQQVTGPQQWEAIARERSDDMLVYLALARFAGRARFHDLPNVLQQDIRAFFSTYQRACAAADEFLFAVGKQDVVNRVCGESAIGKCTREALYLHIDALPQANALLRVYEGCARAYVGSVEGANILKLHRLKPQVSYLSYPDFDSDPHPALKESLKVRFAGLQIEYRDYREYANPFILHRKEAFLAADHPLRAKFERLTKQEEAKGLFADSARIGTRDGWHSVIAARGFILRGHRLVQAAGSPTTARWSEQRALS